jgi:hypothetical protein
MKLPTLFAGIAAVLVFAQQPAPWQPPAGVPAPSFGILQTAPAATVYVDASRGRDTNPGTASRPRQTIPLVLPRCTVVQIVGTYPIAHEGPRTIEAQGTADCPVFIRGGTHTSTWEISGTYLILEQASRGFLVVRATTDGRDTHDVAIRDVEFKGAGLGIQATFSPRGSVYNVVALRLNIHDLGDMNTTTDKDVVGVGIYRAEITSGFSTRRASGSRATVSRRTPRAIRPASITFTRDASAAGIIARAVSGPSSRRMSSSASRTAGRCARTRAGSTPGNASARSTTRGAWSS